MSDGQRGKKRPKSYYKKCAAGGKRQKRGGDLTAGMKGFLVMCNTHEKEAVRETYNILNEYADDLYGAETKAGGGDASPSDSGEDDMEAAMARETASIKNITKVNRRFQQVDTKTKNIIFIRTTVDSPCELAHHVLTDIRESKVQKMRYAIRLLPITITCKANLGVIEETAKNLFKSHFETGFGVAVKYTSVCKIRNNQSINRTSLLPSLGRIIREMNPLHQLCHDEPDLVVLIEVIRNVCCLSVVKDFFTFRKYNMHEVVKESAETQPDCIVADRADREPGNACVVPPGNQEATETTAALTNDRKPVNDDLETSTKDDASEHVPDATIVQPTDSATDLTLTNSNTVSEKLGMAIKQKDAESVSEEQNAS